MATNRSASEGPVALDTLARDLVRSIDDLAECSRAAMVAALELPLTLTEVKALDLLSHYRSITMSDFAGHLHISLPAATHLADRLVAKDTVIRSRSEEDRRVVLLALSDECRESRQRFLEHRVLLGRRMLDLLAPQEQEHTVSVLRQVADLARSALSGSSR